ncbi:MAG: 30S ribosomal protein S6--L-glutamate ligase [Alphaproteobacteria bacterium]|jgi:ribosomal protein S6--L-glutamate ligase|nr:30S ribosomal protein S6--L-glutamate ligase [Alphaproteobacteria bacterium]MBP9776585.1 30S ribosomal protein S6--L-glutamate ligase [Alphaproteobacteria bacterium]
MKLLMMSRNPTLYSHQRLVEASLARGHTIDVIDTLQVYMNMATHHSQIKYKGQLLEGYDVVIPRIGASITMYGLAVLRQLEMMGTWPLNESVAIGRSRDKLRAIQLLGRKGIGLPVTAFSHSTKNIDDMIKMVGGPPVVIKLLEGTQGLGVVLGETSSAARSVIEAFRKINANILVQEYIKEADASDIRCLVVGGKVVATMKRKGPPGDFRSNLHRGGTATREKITPEERSIAVRSAALMGLNVCGVDMLRTHHGPVVMEVNSSPGLEGIEKATGIDVATKIIQYIEIHAKPNHSKTKGKG